MIDMIDMIDTEYTEYTDAQYDEWLAAWDNRDALAEAVQTEASIKRLVGPADAPKMNVERARNIARQAARNIRADESNTLTAVRALAQASQWEYDEHGDPQVFPFDNASTACVRAAMALDPEDHSERAEYLREVAGSVRDHRESFRRGHSRNGHTCRGDLYRGLCH
jgi:hypothetical protein